MCFNNELQEAYIFYFLVKKKRKKLHSHNITQRNFLTRRNLTATEDSHTSKTDWGNIVFTRPTSLKKYIRPTQKEISSRKCRQRNMTQKDLPVKPQPKIRNAAITPQPHYPNGERKNNNILIYSTPKKRRKERGKNPSNREKRANNPAALSKEARPCASRPSLRHWSQRHLT